MSNANIRLIKIKLVLNDLKGLIGLEVAKNAASPPFITNSLLVNKYILQKIIESQLKGANIHMISPVLKTIYLKFKWKFSKLTSFVPASEFPSLFTALLTNPIQTFLLLAKSIFSQMSHNSKTVSIIKYAF